MTIALYLSQGKNKKDKYLLTFKAKNSDLIFMILGNC